MPQRRPALTLAACCAAIGLLFVGLELWAPVQLAYQHALSSAQYLARGAGALISGERGPNYALVANTPDVTDLYTLAALGVPWWLLRRAAVANARTTAHGPLGSLRCA